MKACKDAGKPCFIFTNNAEESRRYLDAGFDAVANSIDSVVITEAYRSFVNKTAASGWKGGKNGREKISSRIQGQ